MELVKDLEGKPFGVTRRIIFKVAVSLVLILTIGFLVSLYIYKKGITPVSTKHTEVLVRIPVGANTGQVSEIMEQKGLIRNKQAFRIYARLHKYDGILKAGEYHFSPDMSVVEILDKLKIGAVETYTFTIPEGFNTKQIVSLLAKKGLVDRDKFMKLVTDGKFNYDFLKDAPAGERRLEGFLFPDTYKIARGTSEEKIINIMLKRFQKEITPNFIARAKSINMTVPQVVTLASIIEREAKVAGDRSLVSAVFHNRIKKNIKLESCATVQYVIENPNKKILTYKDIAVDSPYNTYKRAGLPIAPIASPGKASLMAALNPAKVDYLYFVAKPDGSNEFTTTLAEHEKAKNKYLR